MFPKVFFRLLALAAIVAGASIIGHRSAMAAPTVTIDTGAIRGETEGGADVFRGIPFAAPPIGALRWRPPQPIAPWPGTKDTIAYGPDCLQLPTSNAPGPGFNNPMSEDCLYLNVWTPTARPNTPMPVMVWIYGGAFIMGSGAYPDYDGAHFAEQGVVLITINYRVGLFGFFAHPALSREQAGQPLGDYGYMDQVAALKWVRRNAAAFGGDPSNVTIFGESAGGESVNNLLVTPLARGLFAKAISQSGGGRGGSGDRPWPRLAEAEALGARWAASNGVTGDDAAALRAIPAQTVLLASYPGPYMAQPIIDGQILPEPVQAAMADGRHAVVPYIVGANSDEASLLQWLPNAISDYQATLGPYREPLMAVYGEGGKVAQDVAARRMWGDHFMVEPARYLARGMARSGGPTFLYHYGYVPVAMRGKAPGAPHSGEMNLVFANERAVSMVGEGPADAPMAELMHGYWIAFAKTGDPNGGGRPLWPSYTQANDTLLDITNDGAMAAANLNKTGLDLVEQANDAAVAKESGAQAPR